MKEKEYISIEKMAQRVLSILKDSRDGMLDDDNRDVIETEYSDDVLEERAWDMAYQTNNDMREYLHSKDHKIPGNFNNIDYDYPHHIKGEVEYDFPLVSAMIARLDNGEETEQAQADRDWLVDWFFETFGTFGISYNFETEMAEQVYCEKYEE